MGTKISVSKVINEGFNLYINNFIKLVLPMAIFSIPYNMFVAEMPLFATTYGPDFIAAYMNLGFVVSTLGYSYVSCIIIRVISDNFYQRETDYGAAVQVPVKMFVGVFILSIITQIATTVGIILLIVPGIFVAFGWYVAGAVYVNEEGETIFGAISRSWQLTMGNKGQVFLVSLLFGTIAIVIALILALILNGGVLSWNTITDGILDSPLFTIILTVFVTPVNSVFSTVVYFNLLKLKENFEVNQLSSGFMEDSQEEESYFQ